MSGQPAGPVRVYPIGPPSALNPEPTLAGLGVQPGDVVAAVIELLTRASGRRLVLTDEKLTAVTQQAAILLNDVVSADTDTATDPGARP